jgi:hypothetical protein
MCTIANVKGAMDGKKEDARERVREIKCGEQWYSS